MNCILHQYTILPYWCIQLRFGILLSWIHSAKKKSGSLQSVPFDVGSKSALDPKELDTDPIHTDINQNSQIKMMFVIRMPDQNYSTIKNWFAWANGIPCHIRSKQNCRKHKRRIKTSKWQNKRMTKTAKLKMWNKKKANHKKG